MGLSCIGKMRSKVNEVEELERRRRAQVFVARFVFVPCCVLVGSLI